MLDKAISIAITLFILSMISERIITWLKLHFGQAGRRLWLFSVANEDISHKTGDAEFDNLREKKILGLNIVVSILIAVVAKANLFEIINQEDAVQNLGWKKTDFIFHLSIIKILFGCLFSGLFISLGSKFWHDTVDMLLYAKNLKEKLVQKETFEIDKIEQLNEWLVLKSSDVLKKVIEDNRVKLENTPGVLSVGIGYSDKNEKVIEIQVDGSANTSLPNFLPYTLPSGANKNIPIKQILSTAIKTQLSVGGTITNSNVLPKFGTASIVVFQKSDPSKKPYVLSCYHVLKSDQHSYDIFTQGNLEDISDSATTNSKIGKIQFGIRNHLIDAAYCDTTANIQNVLPGGAQVTATRTIQSNEQFSKIQVTLYGAKSGKQEGIIKSLYNSASIEYIMPNGQIQNWRIYDLIAISGKNGKSISLPGDSGAPVVDSQNRIIGIVVAGNNNYTYLIPIETILNTLNLTI